MGTIYLNGKKYTGGGGGGSNNTSSSGSEASSEELNALKIRISQLETTVTTLTNRIAALESGAKVVVSSSEPSDTSVVWIDTSD